MKRKHKNDCNCTLCKIKKGLSKGKNALHYKHGKTYDNKCIDCGKHISFAAKRCKKCVQQHRNKDKQKHWYCQCGKEIDRYTKQCFICCCKTSRKKRMLGKNNINWKGGKPKCKKCGKTISYGARRCRNCLNNFKIGINHPDYRRIKVNCNYCNKTLLIVKYKYMKNKYYFCNHFHYSCWRIGKFIQGKSPSWRNGSSFEPYSLNWTKKLKESIRKRDNYTCQICYKKGNTVHHIDYNKKNCIENNLITLCKSCHSRTNGKDRNRQKWMIVLKK